MDKQQLLTHINEVLRKDWSRDELAGGKLIELSWSTRFLLKDALEAYAQRGWSITKMASLTGDVRMVALRFRNPKWSLETFGIAS